MPAGPVPTLLTYDPARPLISLHVPKTAGTSLKRHLESWFRPEDLHFHYRGWNGEAPEATIPRPGLCVHGHFNRLRGVGALQYYPDASQFIIFLRDPFDRFVSLWRYLHYQLQSGMKVDGFEDAPPLEAWLDRRAAADPATDPFSFLAQFPEAPDLSDPGSPFRSGFVSIGVMEAYAASLAQLALRLGRTPPEEPAHLNVGTGPTGDFAHLRGRHEAAFAFEHDVYARAAELVRQATPV